MWRKNWGERGGVGREKGKKESGREGGKANGRERKRRGKIPIHPLVLHAIFTESYLNEKKNTA